MLDFANEWNSFPAIYLLDVMMKTLRDQSLDFAEKIVRNWSNPARADSVAYQTRFLHINACGAHETAKSYWILYDNKRFSDGIGLARNSNFSRYAHAGYEVPQPARHNQQSKAADFVALVAPVITATNYHSVDCADCHRGKCDLRVSSIELMKAFSTHTLGNKNRTR